MRRPFTLYKEKTKSGTFWYARFWDEAAMKYKHSRSTGILVEGKKERRHEAEEAARRLFDKLAITKSNVTNTLATHDLTIADMPLIEYLSNFWTHNSEYAQYKRDVKKKPLTPGYIENNHEDIRRHVEPFSGFDDVTVGSLNKAILKKWLIWLAGRKIIRRKKDGTIIEGDTITGRRANIVIQSVR